MRSFVLLAFFVFLSVSAQDPWSVVDSALQKGIDTYGYPGCVAMVGDANGVLYWKSFGNYTYGKPVPMNDNTNPAMDYETIFDMASCTKVTGATSAVAQFYQRGQLDLNTPIWKFLGEAYKSEGKESITVLNCLLHNAGYPPDPDPNYWDPAFNCPQTHYQYPAEDFSCQQQIFNSLLSQTLENPVGQVYVYSDLSFITLQYVVGYLARTLDYVQIDDLVPGCYQGTQASDMCYFEAYLRKYVFQALGMSKTGFLPAHIKWPLCAPAENDTITDDYQNILLQGQVSDGNAYALGGIAGHAGIFSTAADIFTLGHRIMFASSYDGSDGFINATTAAYFTTEYNNTQSCRALGWSTNDPTTTDEGWNLSCGNLSSKTWTHIGYTGTQICGDPERQLITVFLTNRVYPFAGNDQMHTYRQNFNNAVIEALGNTTLSRKELRAYGTNHVPSNIMWKPASNFNLA
mmetsp:Transcript_27014/g.57268  ORF Transcript_27014/g.57268 Transcript_27014/m.57268 type:complete len:460 (-) Transcript_27014:48-1427(-)